MACDQSPLTQCNVGGIMLQAVCECDVDGVTVLRKRCGATLPPRTTDDTLPIITQSFDLSNPVVDDDDVDAAQIVEQVCFSKKKKNSCNKYHNCFLYSIGGHLLCVLYVVAYVF